VHNGQELAYTTSPPSGHVETRLVASRLNVIASGRNLEANELRRAVVNLRKLREDDKALDLIEAMFRRDSSLRRSAPLLQLEGKARIDLAKKCIDTARNRDTSREMRTRAWDLCREYLSDATHIKLLVHDGFGVWCAARRLNAGRFIWPREVSAKAAPMALTQAQFDALVLGLPWQRLAQMQTITRM